MIPLHDDNPACRFPYVTVGLIAVNVAVFILELTYAGSGGLDAFIATWSFVPRRYFADPFATLQVATIFTAMFMHAGWLHLGGNMLYLWIFGNNVEDRLGRVRFLGFYLLAGLAATVGQGLMAPLVNIPNIGASGAVAGVLGAYLILFPRARVLTAVIIIFFIELVRIPALIVIGLWFALQLASGIGSLDPASVGSGGVAYFAHVWGFVAGMVMVLPLLLADRFRKTRFVGWR